MKEILGGKLFWLMTLVAGGFTATISPDDLRVILGALSSIVTAVMIGAYKWHMADKKKRDRLHGDRKCEDEESD